MTVKKKEVKTINTTEDFFFLSKDESIIVSIKE